LLGQPGMLCDLVLSATGCLAQEGEGGEERQQQGTEFFFNHIASE
jgi:hypothetical protein